MILELSSSAKQDVIGIYEYTIQLWGLPQAEKYIALLDEAFETIRQDPHVLLSRDENVLVKSMRSYYVNEHVVFYLFTKEKVSIVRILHQRMDFSRHLA